MKQTSYTPVLTAADACKEAAVPPAMSNEGTEEAACLSHCTDSASALLIDALPKRDSSGGAVLLTAWPHKCRRRVQLP